jgi:hypothetical protein
MLLTVERRGVKEFELTGDVAGRDAVLVDDIIDSGNTFARSARELMARGAARVFAFATHGLLSSDAAERLAKAPIDLLVVTNSVSTVTSKLPADHKLRRKMAVLSVAPMLAHYVCEHAGLPLPVVSATVASEAPHGLTLTVSGMPAAQLHERNGDRILVTGVERRPTDPAVESVRVTLGGIPRAAGPAREAAAVAAGALVLAALGMSLGRGRRGRARSLASLDAERDRVLAEAEELARQKAAGEVGPVSYARRRRELAVWLASLLKERDEVTKVTAPAD